MINFPHEELDDDAFSAVQVQFRNFYRSRALAKLRPKKSPLKNFPIENPSK